MKLVQHIQDILWLSGFTESNIVCPDNQNYEAVINQLSQLWFNSYERVHVKELITSDFIRTMNEVLHMR